MAIRRDAVQLVGRTALLVIDIQRGCAMEAERSGIALMEGQRSFIEHAERVVAAARSAGIPVLFFQEAHRANCIDIGRELDGAESMHCVEGEAATELWPTLRPTPGEELLVKRRYSCFIGTELDILLRGLQISTVVLIGTLTDVCVHYTFADAHQRDLHVKVVADAVLGSSVTSHEAALDAMVYLQRHARLSTLQVEEAFALLAASTA